METARRSGRRLLDTQRCAPVVGPRRSEGSGWKPVRELEHPLRTSPVARGAPRAPGVDSAAAFTLIETLVVMGIIAVLMSILVPVLSSARRTVQALQCASNMKTVTTQFGLFVDGNSAAGRGDSEALGGRRFFINDFQESLYRIDEFWDAGATTTQPLIAGGEPMLCPAGAPQLQRRKGFPCGSQAVGPPDDVSLAVNMRLYRRVIDFKGQRILAPSAGTKVRSSVLDHPYVPLILDVDGAEAAARGLEPFYTAPPLVESQDPYADGRFWMPSRRHGGKTNVAFVGGHVLSSAQPDRERWDWQYQAD